MTYETFQSPGTELCDKEALIMEQRGVASSRANSLYIFIGRSVGAVALLHLIFFYPGDNVSFMDRGRRGGGGKVGR